MFLYIPLSKQNECRYQHLGERQCVEIGSAAVSRQEDEDQAG